MSSKSAMTPARALKIVRSLLDLDQSLEEIFSSGLIPAEHHAYVNSQLENEKNFVLEPATVLELNRGKKDWLKSLDRLNWHFWPTLRQYLIRKGWDTAALRSLDDASDRILKQLEPPTVDKFDIRGLVLGYVQSGKTANFTAVISKAVDAGYRLVIVLSGIDNGLRLQTQLRLRKELVGYPDSRPSAVKLPPIGLRWHEFTRDDINGDFDPGYATHGALQGSQPVLLVVKKNSQVLQRLLRWLDEAPKDVQRKLPVLVVDDEADQASIDTNGSYQTEDALPDPDYEDPSIINGLIRDLLNHFGKKAYIAYTATPFANILIPHDTVHAGRGNDLYPKDFIVDLPRPAGYFGAEEFFGRVNPSTGEESGGIDVVRTVPINDLAAIHSNTWPASLEEALLDFVLAAAARGQRGKENEPATMLIHTSQLVASQAAIHALVENRFVQLRDEWRYQRKNGLTDMFQKRWVAEFVEKTSPKVDFKLIEPCIGPFLESVQIREINSQTGEALDYEREPGLKAIAIGGNRLSRGLTLEGLLVSYFIRRSITYDTLMQMGRWFGFRSGYEDLIRIYTTNEIEDWFCHLAFVEHRLREDIRVLESLSMTPQQVGLRIAQHPTMQVTSALKRRFATNMTISQSYSFSLEQTVNFPLRNLPELAYQSENNRLAIMSMVRRIGKNTGKDGLGPIWSGVRPEEILKFLDEFKVDESSMSFSLLLIKAYISRCMKDNELTSWTLAIRGRQKVGKKLGQADWGLPNGPVNQISRSRKSNSNSVGVITNSNDELVALPPEVRVRVEKQFNDDKAAGLKKTLNNAAREARPATEGLLLLYPISRYSGVDKTEDKGNRKPLFDNLGDASCRDLVGMAISFPRSSSAHPVEAYLRGTVGWRPVDEQA